MYENPDYSSRPVWLVDEGRVQVHGDPRSARYAVADCVIAVGDAACWEAAVFDHYQAMVTALCAKLRRGVQKSGADDTVGGSTYNTVTGPIAIGLSAIPFIPLGS